MAPRIASVLPHNSRGIRRCLQPSAGTQCFRYLIYYVWSELPPAEKPADIVLSSLKAIPVGTPVEEIERVSDAFGLDFNFMKAFQDRVRFRPPSSAPGRISACTRAKTSSIIRLRADSQSPRQCRCSGLKDHYLRHSVRMGDAQEADLERSLLDPSTRLERHRRAHPPT